jgi:hypothetical protein
MTDPKPTPTPLDQLLALDPRELLKVTLREVVVAVLMTLPEGKGIRRTLYGPYDAIPAKNTAEGILRGNPSDEDFGGIAVKVFLRRLFRRISRKGL